MPRNVRSKEWGFTAVKRDELNARQFFLDNYLACIARMQKNDNFTALQSVQGILHITALQPCKFLPLLKTLELNGHILYQGLRDGIYICSPKECCFIFCEAEGRGKM